MVMTSSSSTTANPRKKPRRADRTKGSDTMPTIVDDDDEFCDICQMSGGVGDDALSKLHKCTGCALFVHGPCYGLDNRHLQTTTTALGSFTCHACQTVGKEVEGRIMRRSLIGNDGRHHHQEEPQYLKVLQKTRPTECVLCSVTSTKRFAMMHPLFDMCGPRGRQIVLPATTSESSNKDDSRLAWIHTLCGKVVEKKLGFIRGCHNDGSPHLREEGTSETSTKNNNSSRNLPPPPTANSSDTSGVHHFAYRCQESDLSRRILQLEIHEHQKRTCIFCEEDDTPPNVLRIPLQCCAGKPNESHVFDWTHEELGFQSCQVAFHAGCAMWKKKPHKNRVPQRVLFIPGEDGKFKVVEAYCRDHALDIKNRIY